MSDEEKVDLLKKVDPKKVSAAVGVELVGSSKKLFKEWLEFQTHRYKQLAPLTNPEIENWHDLLVIALEHNFEPFVIATHIATSRAGGWSGSEADMWRGRQSSFREILSQDDTNSRITKTIVYVLKELDQRIEDAERAEQLTELRH